MMALDDRRGADQSDVIEQGIYFSIGCIVTALLALAFGPVFWNRALRLTRRRLQLQVPLSMREILADRDQLRAHFAVERVRLEQAMERIHASKAIDMASIGRRTAEAASLAEKLDESRRLEQSQEREIQRLGREASETGAELGSVKMALHDAALRVERLTSCLASASDDNEGLRDEVRDRRAMIASLETRATGLELRILDGERAHAAKEKRNEAALRGRLEAAMGHATRHEASAVSLRRECDDARAQARALEQERDAALERERGANLQRSLEAAKTEKSDTEELARSRAEIAALQGELEEARHASATGLVSLEDDEELRASIHSLGLAVALLSREPRDPKPPRTIPQRDKLAAPTEADRPD